MKSKFLIPLTALAVFTLKTDYCVSAQLQDNDTVKTIKTARPHKCPKPTMSVQVSYNSASTTLNVSIPTNGQVGRIEIYRNGTKVINISAPAGASLSYVLRKYGIGSYAIIVSSGKTVVYNNCVEVR